MANTKETETVSEQASESTRNRANTILALDTASRKTGYALYRNGKIFKSGTWKLGERYHKDLYLHIESTIKRYNVTKIVYENIYKDKDVRKQSAFDVLSQCQSILMLIIQQRNLMSTPRTPLEIKDHLKVPLYSRKDKRNTTRTEQKDKMIEIVTNRYGYQLEKPKADDESDAIGLLITDLEKFNRVVTHPNGKKSGKYEF